MLKLIFGLIVLSGLVYVGWRVYRRHVSNKNIKMVMDLRDYHLKKLDEANAAMKISGEKKRLADEHLANVIKKEKEQQDERARKMRESNRNIEPLINSGKSVEKTQSKWFANNKVSEIEVSNQHKEIESKGSLSAWEVFESYSDEQKKQCLILMDSAVRNEKLVKYNPKEDVKLENEFYYRSLQRYNIDEWVILELDREKVRKIVLSIYRNNNVSEDNLHYYETYDNFSDNEKGLCFELWGLYGNFDSDLLKDFQKKFFIEQFNRKLSDDQYAALWKTAEHIDKDYIYLSRKS